MIANSVSSSKSSATPWRVGVEPTPTGCASGGDDDIRASRFLREVFGSGVTDRHRCVAVLGLLDQQIGEGLADDVRAADDCHVFTLGFDAC